MADVTAGARLVLDTATARLVLALRAAPDRPPVDASGPAERGASALGVRLAGLVTTAGLAPRQLRAVGIGTGPGSFTGLRVGLATAKALAWSLHIPVVGIATVEGLRRAAAIEAGPDPAGFAVVQAAGARDHYLTLPGAPARLVPPGTDLASAVQGHPVLAPGVDRGRLHGVLGPGGGDPVAAGEAALAGLGAALLALLDERLAAGPPDDAATLVPAYVALPRGIVPVSSGHDWVPDLR